MSTPKWFKRELPGGRHYYTPFPEPKRRNYAIGDGTKTPTPGEIAEALEKDPRAVVDRGLYLITQDQSNTGETAVELPADCYRYHPGGWSTPEALYPKSLRDDTYVGISTLYEPIAKEIRAFIKSSGYKNDTRKILKRLGILLPGPPGNGKTCLIRELAYREMPKGSAIIFMPGSVPTEEFTKVLDKSLGDRVKLIIFEELAAAVEYHPIEPLLDFLDGEASMDNTITIATTNYPQMLPKSLLERTSRFDLLFYIDNPTAQERKEFLEQFGKIKVSDQDVKDTQGMSIADLKEIVLSAERRGETFQGAINRLKERRSKVNEILGRKST